MKHVIIGGIGNATRGDDGIGPYVAAMFYAQYEFGPEVQVLDLGTPGFELSYQFAETDALILVDSLDNGRAPGSIATYRNTGVAGGPAELVLIGVVGEHYDSGSLSDSARAAAEDALDAVLAELDRLGVRYTRRSRPLEIAGWWPAQQCAKAEVC